MQGKLSAKVRAFPAPRRGGARARGTMNFDAAPLDSKAAMRDNRNHGTQDTTAYDERRSQGMRLLQERIRRDGKVLPGNIVKVDGF